MKPTLPLAALGLALILAAPALAQRAPLSETIVDVSADREPVRDVLRRLEGRHGLNYVVSEEVLANAGSVTVRLKQVPLEDALHAICAACGLSLEIRGRILVVLPRETRRLLPPVRKSKKDSSGSDYVRRKGEGPSTERPPVRVRRPSPRASNSKRELARAVGTVLEVDRKNRLLRIDADGLKRDFYFIPPEGAGVAQTARLEGAMARLARGHRVALEYMREGGRSLVVSLVGGDEVRDRRLAVARKPPTAGGRGVTNKDDETAAPEQAPRPKNKSRIEGPSNPNTAPEGVNIPDGVLAGRFVSYADEKVSVRRADGKVVSVALPKDADRRAKILAVVETLDEGVKVYFIYGEEDGKKVIKDTGITEVKPSK